LQKAESGEPLGALEEALTKLTFKAAG
jgi:hypothetical protein